MGLLNIISNEVKAAIGYQQNFADLLTAKDVTRALSMMKAHAEEPPIIYVSIRLTLTK